MKNRKLLWCVLVVSVLVGYIVLFAEGGKLAEAAEVVEVTETSLSENVVYDGSVVINYSLDLNGYVLQINGDLKINGSVNLNKGTLVVKGNIWHTGGCLEVGEGIVDVEGDYRIQNKRILADGTEDFLESYGVIRMKRQSGVLKIGGDFVNQSCSTRGYTYDYNDFAAGTMEIGGDIYIKNGADDNFRCYNAHTIILTGEKTHRIDIETGNSQFANLKSEGKIEWKGYVNINKMLSDLTIVPILDGKSNLMVLYCGDINGKCLNFMGDITFDKWDKNLNGGTLVVDGNVLYAGGKLNLDGGIVTLKGNLLQTGGEILVNEGILEVLKDYKIQNTRILPDGTVQYIDSDGRLWMGNKYDLVKISGDFVIQSSYDGKCYSGGIIEIGGDIIQRNGYSYNFYCSDDHKVILNGKKSQKIEFESENAKFAHLVITKPLSSYTFSRTPCWDTLEESATSISDCKIKSISKQAYTGKALKPSVTITYQDSKLIQDTDYTLSYANNKNTGKATVTITGIGAYTGSVEKSFQIVPAKVTEVKVTSSTTGQVTLTWKKDATATGYVIEYSMDKSFKKNVKKITINKKATTSREITKLTANKTYYFRIRAYKTISGKKAYGAYSSVVSVSVK